MRDPAPDKGYLLKYLEKDLSSWPEALKIDGDKGYIW